MNLYYYLDNNTWEARMKDGFDYSPADLGEILAGIGAPAKPVGEDGIPFLTKEDMLIIGADILETVPENVGALLLLGGLVGAERRENEDAAFSESAASNEESGAQQGAGGTPEKPGEEKNPVTNLSDCDGDCISCGGSCGDDEDSGPDPKVYEILLRTRTKGTVRAKYMISNDMLPLPVPILPSAGSFQPMRMAVSIDQNGFETSMPALLWRGDLFFDFRFDVAKAIRYAQMTGEKAVEDGIAADFIRVLRMGGAPLFYEEMHAAASSFKPADVRNLTVIMKKNVYRISAKKEVYVRAPGTPAKAYLDGARTSLLQAEIGGETALLIRIPAGQHRVSWE